MLDTHFTQTESGLLDSCDQCTLFMHATNDMLYMWIKLNHTNLFMKASSPLLNKFRSIVVSGKKILVYIKKKKKIRFVFVV